VSPRPTVRRLSTATPIQIRTSRPINSASAQPRSLSNWWRPPSLITCVLISTRAIWVPLVPSQNRVYHLTEIRAYQPAVLKTARTKLELCLISTSLLEPHKTSSSAAKQLHFLPTTTLLVWLFVHRTTQGLDQFQHSGLLIRSTKCNKPTATAYWRAQSTKCST